MKPVLALDSTDAGLEAGLEAAGYTLMRAYHVPEVELGPYLATAEGILLRSRIRITEPLLAQAPALQWIGRLGSGVENIDQAAAQRRGVALYSAPEGNRSAVGEHAVGMLLSLTHKIVWAHREVIGGAWNRASNTGWELEGSTIGIIGFGHMGSAFAQRLQGFGVRILAYDKYKTGYAPAYVKEATLDRVLSESDVLSLHLPLTAETEGMVDAPFLRQCAKASFLVNTSRGGVIRSSAVWDAVQQGHLRGAALDVLDLEKRSLEGLEGLPPWWNAFLSDPRVLVTPHIAGWSEQSFPKMGEILITKILKGHP